MKTLKRIIVGALGVLGFVLACNNGYQPSLDFWGIVCLIGAIVLGIKWKVSEDESQYI
jgi:hypothetical protein